MTDILKTLLEESEKTLVESKKTFFTGKPDGLAKIVYDVYTRADYPGGKRKVNYDEQIGIFLNSWDKEFVKKAAKEQGLGLNRFPLNKIPLSDIIYELTGKDVGFDGVDMYDAKTSKTLMHGALDGNHTLDQLVAKAGGLKKQ